MISKANSNSEWMICISSKFLHKLSCVFVISEVSLIYFSSYGLTL